MLAGVEPPQRTLPVLAGTAAALVARMVCCARGDTATGSHPALLVAAGPAVYFVMPTTKAP